MKGQHPHRFRRLFVGLVGIGIAVVFVVSVAGAYVSQTHLIRWEATVTSRTCVLHQGDGDGDSPYTTCTVNLSYYRLMDGAPDSVVLHGIDISRIHGQNTGHETMYIYFSDPFSDTPINPQDNFPWWVIVIVAVPALAVGMAGFMYIWRGFRPKPTKGEGHGPDPSSQSGAEVNQPSWEEVNRQFWEARTTSPAPPPEINISSLRPLWDWANQSWKTVEGGQFGFAPPGRRIMIRRLDSAPTGPCLLVEELQYSGGGTLSIRPIA